MRYRNGYWTSLIGMDGTSFHLSLSLKLKVESLTIEHMEALSKCHVFVKIRKLIDDTAFTFIKIINQIEFHLLEESCCCHCCFAIAIIYDRRLPTSPNKPGKRSSDAGKDSQPASLDLVSNMRPNFYRTSYLALLSFVVCYAFELSWIRVEKTSKSTGQHSNTFEGLIHWFY